MTFNYSMYGFINLDWTIEWIDSNNISVNNAYFDSSNNPGTFTEYTYANNFINSNNAGQPQFYNGTLNEIYIYDSYGNSIVTSNSIGQLYTPLITYNTSQWGTPNLKNNNYIYPNIDTFNISNFFINDGSNTYIEITNFNVSSSIYTTNYYSNFIYDFNTSNGCRLPETYNYLNNYYTDNINNISYKYELYYSSGIEIPTLLKNKFNISEYNSLNIFTNKNSNAVSSNGLWWNYFSNNQGNPSNTGWVIINVIVSNS